MTCKILKGGHASCLSSSLRRLELGYAHGKPSRVNVLGGLRSSKDQEYGLWTVSSHGTPHMVPPFALAFSTTALDGHALLACDEEGIVTILDSRRSLTLQMDASTPETRPYSRFRCHNNAIFDATWLHGNQEIATAGGDAAVRIFDVPTKTQKAELRGASGSIKSVRPYQESRYIVASASRDGNVRIHDIRTPTVHDLRIAHRRHHRPIATLYQPHAPGFSPHPEHGRKRQRGQMQYQGKTCNSVTSIAFHPGRPLMYTAGAEDGRIKLWDLRKTPRACGGDGCVGTATPGLEHQDENRWRACGIASVDVDPTGQRVLASTTDSRIFLYPIGGLSYGYSQVLTGHVQTSFYIRARFSACGTFVASGSADSKAYIWDTATGGRNLQPMLQLDGHRRGEVSAVTWCHTDRTKLATCADDSTVKVWQIVNGEKAGDEREDGDDISNGARRVRKRDQAPINSSCYSFSARSGRRRRLKTADIRTFFSIPE